MLVRIILLIGSAIGCIVSFVVMWHDTNGFSRIRNEEELLILVPVLALFVLNFFYVWTSPTNHSIGQFFRRFINAWKSASKDE